MRKTLLLLATLIWLAFWWWWYTCKICTTCLCAQKEVPVVTAPPQEQGVVLFNHGDSVVLIQNGWPAFRDSLIKAMAPNQGLEIEGHFLDEEPNPTGFANLGLARASALSQLFPDSLRSRITLASIRIDKREGMDLYPFKAASWNIRPAPGKIVETGGKTLIYFQTNSKQRIQDPEIETYLSGLADAHRNERSVFEITGHTDHTGPEKENIRLGLARARSIKNYLVGKGIDASRIRIYSKGESEPIASNDTDEGRRMNRRTEIEIIQKL